MFATEERKFWLECNFLWLRDEIISSLKEGVIMETTNVYNADVLQNMIMFNARVNSDHRKLKLSNDERRRLIKLLMIG